MNMLTKHIHSPTQRCGRYNSFYPLVAGPAVQMKDTPFPTGTATPVAPKSKDSLISLLRLQEAFPPLLDFASSAASSLCICRLLAHQAVHRPGLLQAGLRAEAPLLAASPAAQRAQAALVPSTHLCASGGSTPPTSAHCFWLCLANLGSRLYREYGPQAIMLPCKAGQSRHRVGCSSHRPVLAEQWRTVGCSTGRPALPAASSAPPAAAQPPSPRLTAQAAAVEGLLLRPPCQAAQFLMPSAPTLNPAMHQLGGMELWSSRDVCHMCKCALMTMHIRPYSTCKHGCHSDMHV